MEKCDIDELIRVFVEYVIANMKARNATLNLDLTIRRLNAG